MMILVFTHLPSGLLKIVCRKSLGESPEISSLKAQDFRLIAKYEGFWEGDLEQLVLSQHLGLMKVRGAYFRFDPFRVSEIGNYLRGYGRAYHLDHPSSHTSENWTGWDME